MVQTLDEALTMSLDDPFRDPLLARVIELHIQARTLGCIDRLKVLVTPDRRIIIRGCIADSYLKQLVVTAALELVDSDDHELVELHISGDTGAE